MNDNASSISASSSWLASSLDDASTQELMKILRNLGQSTNVFVISHKGDILADKFMTTLKFEKINDFSKMKDES